jgi:hypothetical protein
LFFFSRSGGRHRRLLDFTRRTIAAIRQEAFGIARPQVKPMAPSSTLFTCKR